MSGYPRHTDGTAYSSQSRRFSFISAKSTSNTADSSDFSGKALKVFGRITVRRKLSSLRSVFPHTNDTAIKDIASIYDDVLALARPGIYSEFVSRAASKLLLEQIGSGQTDHLTQAFTRRPLVEVLHFLFTLMTTCMNEVEQTHDSLKSKEKTAALSPSSKEALVLAPLLNLISKIGAKNEATCRAVLEAGVLNVLLRVYVAFPLLSDSAMNEVERKLALLDACRSTLEVLSQSSENQEMILSHPVYVLWTDCRSHPMGYNSLDSPMDDRCAAWRRADRSCVKRRLVAIYRGSLWKSNIDTTADIEACVDIVEFTRSGFYDSEIVELALLTMLKHIVLSGDSARHLINALAENSYEELTHIFSGVLRLWLECVGIQLKKYSPPEFALSGILDVRIFRSAVPQIETEKTSYDHEKDRFIRKISDVDSALLNLIEFAKETADESATMRLGILDAGGLALVLCAFASVDFQLSGLVNNSVMQGNRRASGLGHRVCEPLPLSAINAEASALSVLIHSSKFRRTWRGRRFQTRLALCSSLVYSLLGENGRTDDRYEVASALFRKIVAVDSRGQNFH